MSSDDMGTVTVSVLKPVFSDSFSAGLFCFFRAFFSATLVAIRA